MEHGADHRHAYLRRNIKGINYLVLYISTYVRERGKPQSVAYMTCSKCGSIIKDPIAHSSWHRSIEKMQTSVQIGEEI